jgi:hypothetical protein
MLAGDPTLRTPTSKPPGICHRCLSTSESISGGNGAPCSSNDTSAFPNKSCPGGIRATIIFPSCWDGINLDSPDHKSHVAYAPGNRALADDKCPATHPVRIPQVMYEVMFDTAGFTNPKYFENGRQPFVYSFGDPYVSSTTFTASALVLIGETGLATAPTATTFLVGKAMRCNAEWMRWEALVEVSIVIRCLRFSLEKRRLSARSNSRRRRMLGRRIVSGVSEGGV